MRRCCERIDGVTGQTGGRREGFGEGGPHTASASRADGDVGMLVLGGESEKWSYLYAVNAENMLTAW